MRVAAAAATIQARYEAGDISYPRTSARTLGPGAVASAARLGVSKPPLVTETGARGRRPHEAVHVLCEDLPGFRGVPQHLLPVEMQFLDRLARATVRAAVPLPVERPKTSDLPAWARDLPWWRPGPDFPASARSVADGCDLRVRAEIFDFDAEEVAFEALVRESLGRPSSIADHAIRAVERGFVDAQGLTSLGEAALEHVPPSLTLPGIALAVEEAIESDAVESPPEGPPVDLIERCFGLMPELAPRLRAALRRGEGGGDSEMKPAASATAAATGQDASESDRWYWAARLATGTDAEVEEETSVGDLAVHDPAVAAKLDEANGRAASVEEPIEAAPGALLDARESRPIAPATDDDAGARESGAGEECDWTWLTREAPPAPVDESDSEWELDDDEQRTAHAPRGPQPW